MEWGPYLQHQATIEGAIRGVARRHHLRRADADDFAQDARLFIARNASRIFLSFQGRSSLATFISRVVWRFSIDWLRTHSVRERRTEPFDEWRTAKMGGTEGDGDAPILAFRGCAAVHSVRQWFRDLSPNDRDLLVRRFADEKTMAEIATQLETTPSACFKRFYRLLEAARKTLEAKGFGREDCACAERWLRSEDVSLFPDERERERERERDSARAWCRS